MGHDTIPSERAILGAVLLYGGQALVRLLALGLQGTDFASPDLGRIFDGLAARHAAGLGVDIETLSVVDVRSLGMSRPITTMTGLSEEATLMAAFPEIVSTIRGQARERRLAVAVSEAAADPRHAEGILVAALAPSAHGVADATPLVVDCRPPTDYYERGDDVELGQHLAAAIGGRGCAVYDDGEVWRSLSGATWEALPPEALELAAQGYAGQRMFAGLDKKGEPKSRPILLGSRRTDGIATVCRRWLGRSGWFGERQVGAAFLDSFWRLDGERIVREPLLRGHRVRTGEVSPFALPDLGSAPRFLSLLRQTWDEADDVEERIAYLLEWLGAALLGITTRWKDSPLLVGPKDSGKSRILDALVGVFPASSRRAISLHALTQPYDRARLVGARINAVSELPSRELLDSEAAKAILSGDTVSARQPYGRVFEVSPRCAHVFAANELPPSLDRALTGRFVLLDCLRPVPEPEQDHDLGRTLAAEAPGIARLALDAVPALLARRRFVRPGSSRALDAGWRMLSDSVEAWAAAALRAGEERMAGATLYDHYRRWCEENGHRPMASNRWGLRLRAAGFERVRSDGTWWLASILTPEEQRAERTWGMRMGP